jgi:transglutaminase/protease-like cytokinesis protein 3
MIKPTPVLYLPPVEPKASNNLTGFVPCDPTAFEASLCRQRQLAIDNMSYRQSINSSKAKAFHDVVQLILDLSSGKNLIDRAWLVFYWISQNIEYDVEAYFSGNIRHQTSDDVFANRKGVCDAFGTIFETLCNAVQIECKKIGGYAKGYGFKQEQATFARTNHAWNVIRLNGRWYLVDSTWGTGHLNNNNCNQKALNPFYFLARPEQMIYRHLPEDSKWQLLASPVSMQDFVRLPFVDPTFFELELDIIYPRHSNMASFSSSLGLAEVLVRAPFNIALMGDIKQATSGKITNGSLVQYDADRQLWQCLFAPQCGGFHTLTIFGRREKQAENLRTNESSYSCVIQLGLHVPAEFRGRKTFPLT